MPKLWLTVAVLFDMGRPSLAVQKRTEAEVEESWLAGLKTVETEWTFGEIGESCDSACKQLCSTATCDKLGRLEIDSGSKLEDLAKSIAGNPCSEYSEGQVGGPYVSGDKCFAYDGVSSAADECNAEPSGVRNLCACEITLGTCSVSEDPHVNVFDGSQISLLRKAEPVVEAAEEKWLVKSASVKIQARFQSLGSNSLRERSKFTRAIAIGGDILNGNVMVVGSLKDQVTWNGEPVLTEQQSHFYLKDSAFFVNATRGSSSVVQDLSKENLGVNIRLRSGVRLIVNRLPRHLNVAIQMPQQPGGQEGICGNFNGVGADDALEMVSNRFDLNVAPDESLFVGLSFD